MNIKLIDQGLNVAIAGLIYGSEVWFLCAFSWYVASRRSKATSELPSTAQLAEIPTAAEMPEMPMVAEIPQPLASGTLEISIFHAVEPKIAEVQPNWVDQALTVQAIACEPVNWKKWKVNDLRDASIAKECGVKTQPIGSRRNLTKADLVAQYKQNLKRLTKAPPKQAGKAVIEKTMIA